MTKYHLALHGLKANNPTNSLIISRLQRFFSLRNEIILFTLFLLEKNVLIFARRSIEGMANWHLSPKRRLWCFCFFIQNQMSLIRDLFTIDSANYMAYAHTFFNSFETIFFLRNEIILFIL